MFLMNQCMLGVKEKSFKSLIKPFKSVVPVQSFCISPTPPVKMEIIKVVQ